MGSETALIFCSISVMRGSRKFCQRGPNLISFLSYFFSFLVDEGIEDPNSTINGSPSAQQ